MNILVIVIIYSFVNCYVRSNGYIWDKAQKNFVPIFTIEQFKHFHDQIINKSRQTEIHKFDGQELHFIYFEDVDFFEFYDNDTKVRGINGDIWTILSEYLNFTMVLKKYPKKEIGTRLRPNENFTGLLGSLERREYTVIPKLEAFAIRYEAVDFSFPLYTDQQRLFVKRIRKFNTFWMLELFSLKIWYLIIVFYILLSIVGIISYKLNSENYSLTVIKSIIDYLFYSFGALCNQGGILYSFQNKIRILSLSMSLFSWFFLSCFSSQIIIHMTQITPITPFYDLDSLFHDTDYTILAEKYSAVYLGFLKKFETIFTKIQEAGRVEFHSDLNKVWKLPCSDDHRYTIFHSQRPKFSVHSNCRLHPTGAVYFKTWVVAGIVKDFEFKSSINIAILKLFESGIIQCLKVRWLQLKTVPNPAPYYPTISLYQVSLIFSVYLFGLCASIVVLLFEKIIYFNSVESK